VGKTIPEVQKAYLAGFIDGDGTIMALLERNPAKRFGLRLRVWVKVTQLRREDVAWLADDFDCGQVVRVANVGSGWSRTRTTSDSFSRWFNRMRVSKRDRLRWRFRFRTPESTP
jgi:hypothetical protein